MKLIYSLALATVLIIPGMVWAKAAKGLQKDMVLQYLVREPATKTATSPVIILLHGYGSNEADLFSLADQMPPDAIVLCPRAPIDINADGHAWYPITRPNAGSSDPAAPERARQLILNFIAQAAKKYNTPASRIYLMGFSQGAIMSYNIALTQPDKVKGIVVMSGRLMEEIKSKVAKPEQVNKVSIFIAHGTEDQVLPISCGRDAHKYLDDKKIKNDYHEYKMVHTISNEELRDVQLWLKKDLKR